jgi:hypothetical protein
MNDLQIRESFHRKKLYKHRTDQDTLIVDELGLKHGKCRADIAVINTHLIGYEIKSDDDSLRRLDRQIETYNNVFDQATVIVGTKHAKAVSARVPEWWGIILTHRGSRGGVSFETIRQSRMNGEIDLFSVAQLLWSNEVISILMDLGLPQRDLHKKRSLLYKNLIDLLNPTDLRCRVRDCLKSRKNWKCPEQPFPNGGLSQPFSRLTGSQSLIYRPHS